MNILPRHISQSPLWRMCLGLVSILWAAGVPVAAPAEAPQGEPPEEYLDDQSAVAVERIASVYEALRERGIRLVVAAMPYRSNLYPSPDTSFSEPFPEPQSDTYVTRHALQRLTGMGMPTIDLGHHFLHLASQSEIYIEDRFHLTFEGQEKIGRAYLSLLERGKFLSPPEGKFTTFMGECFSNEFYQHMNVIRDGLNVRQLIAYGDRWMLPNKLFLFESEYLEGCDRVIWLLPYAFFSSLDIPPITTDPTISHAETIERLVKVVEPLGVPYAQLESELQASAYTKALAEIRCVDEESGEQLILVDYAGKERTPTGLEEIYKGDLLRIRSVGLNAHMLATPEVAKDWYYKTLDDHKTPREFMRFWVKIEN